MDDEEEEIPSELVEFACFKGDRETVLQNSALQYPMFLVLRKIATLSEKGTLTAITEEDGELEATRIVEGEPRPASIEVVESPQGPATATVVSTGATTNSSPTKLRFGPTLPVRTLTDFFPRSTVRPPSDGVADRRRFRRSERPLVND